MLEHLVDNLRLLKGLLPLGLSLLHHVDDEHANLLVLFVADLDLPFSWLGDRLLSGLNLRLFELGLHSLRQRKLQKPKGVT